MQLLTELFRDAGIAAQVPENVRVSAVITDSRQAMPDALFVVIAGTQKHGAAYIADAVTRGASVVVTETQSDADSLPSGVIGVVVRDTREAAAKLAASFYAPQPTHVVAVTGTDGKTSTAEFARQFFAGAGASAASMGTLGLRSPIAELNAEFPANNTSPEPVLLHRTLQALAAKHVQHVAIEASSHGLHQKRLDGVRLTAAAFTNLSRDHLDYHGTIDAYFAAKARLFDTLLTQDGAAIINADDAYGKTLVAATEARGIAVQTYGKQARDYRIISLVPHTGGIRAALEMEGAEHHFDVPLYGGFQIYNMLAAYGLVRRCNFASETLLPQFTKMRGVRGRLERVALHASGAAMFIDYAHTPAALENILHTLRAHTEHKLHVVFGCGGDRDAGKRPVMGEVAARLADRVIITDDNPRSEAPASIRAAIRSAAPGALEIGDRAEAIETAIRNLGAGDVLVVAGKGHEEYQIVGEQTLHFDDAEIIRKAVGA